MATPKINDVDRRVIGGMSGSEKIRFLLKEAGYETYRDLAIELGRYVEEVSMCINGRREYGEIRDALAQALGLPREQIDRLIETPAPEAS